MGFYGGKRVLVTGHTGFKGTWLSEILVNEGAEVLGYSRCSEKMISLFELSGVEKRLEHVKGDVRDYSHVERTFINFKPEIVFHLAAQPIVRESYENPRYSYETNVMGTVNVLEAIRQTSTVKSVVIVTTDKVYKNNEWTWGYRESDVLDGFDPYSNSKSCAELAVASYRRSFFDEACIPISTARAGNVIGGGDFARDRIIPDCIRAVRKDEPVVVRNPHSVRPYQHVLEPLFAYLQIAEKQYVKPELSGCFNIGPYDFDCITTGRLVSLFCDAWGENARWIDQSEKNAPHEAGFLKLDCSKINTIFDWHPKWNVEQAINLTVKFTKDWLNGGIVSVEMNREILEYVTM